MTAHPIDAGALREWIESQRHHEGVTLHVSTESAGALIDLLAAAEHRATRAEAQSAIRGRAVVIYQGRAREAEARLAGWMEHWNATARTGAVDEVAAILEANARADHAEARIKAVQDVLDSIDTSTEPALHDGFADIRRALDGSVTSPDTE